MRLKTRAFGFLAGVSLVFSLANGVVAQTTTEVELTEAACAPGITQMKVDFGTYVYDPTINSTGGFRAATATDGKASFTVADTSAGRQANCRIQVEASQLLDSNRQNGINVTLTESSGAPTGNPITVTVAPGSGKTVNATLPDSLPKTSPIDTYAGTITVTIATGN